MMLSIAVRRPGFTVQQSLERMERFATKVMPLVYGMVPSGAAHGVALWELPKGKPGVPAVGVL